MKYTSSLIAAFLLILPLTMWAQDDMYFASSKKAKKEAEKRKAEKQSKYEIIYADDDEPLDIVGSGRDVDEYNRRYSVSNRKGQAQLVQQPDGSFAYEIPQEDSVTVSTRSLLNNAYERGYDEGYIDGEDYALTRRMGRFGYSSVYVSPWYSTYYSDPFYWDSWYYWNDPFYYSWSRPYWGYSSYYYGYGPYHYGYGWNRPYYYGGWRGTTVHRGGHIPRNTQYKERYYDLRHASRPANHSRVSGSSNNTRSVRSGQNAPLGNRGSSTIRNPIPSNSGSSSSSRSGSSVSRSSSSSTSSAPSRSGTGGFGGQVLGGGGNSGGGGGGSRSARGGRR